MALIIKAHEPSDFIGPTGFGFGFVLFLFLFGEHGLHGLQSVGQRLNLVQCPCVTQ
jgi:hypothetical protein